MSEHAPPVDTYDLTDTPVAFTGDPALLDAWNHGLDHYLTQLTDLIFDDGDAVDTAAGTITGLPFDGCSLCFARESMAWLIPRVLSAARDGLLEVVDR